MPRMALLVAALALSPNVAAPTAALAAGQVPSGASPVLVHGEDEAGARIGTYVSSDNGFVTSSYWIEGEQGLVIIDTQFLLSAAEELIKWAEASTGKKVALAIVLHPNPDKFNGAAVFNRRGIPVVTSSQVLARLPAVHQLRKSWFYDEYKPDYPADLPKIESFGDRTRELEAGGVKLKLHVLGKGCSDAHVVVEYKGHIFPGDLVTNDFHAWLELGYLEEWLDRLAELQALDPSVVHPGRGPAGGPGLLRQQASYLQTVLRIVRAARPRGPARESALQSLQAKIEAAYPGYRYPLFVTNGLEAVWERQSRAGAARARAITTTTRH